MYPGDILARLQSLDTGVSPVAPAAAIGADPMTTSSERVTARVEQKLADGLFKVQIGIRTLQIALPPQTAVGSKLELRQAPGGRWVPADPQVVLARVDAELADGTFSVAVGGRTLQLALPAETAVGQQIQLRQAADGSWSVVAPADETSTQTAMSNTGRLVDLLLQAAPRQSPQTAGSTPLLAAAPAESAMPALPPALMRALATALNDSGLFYESHLQQWNAGARAQSTLAREPQAQLNSPGTLIAASPGITPAAGDTSQAQTYAAAEPAMAASLQQAGVHPDALPLIARQLGVLETGQLTWNGELWPGQSMQWSIGRDDTSQPEDRESFAGGHSGGNAGSTARNAPIWRTRLALNLPQLGAVTANLALQGNAVRISLSVPAPAAKASLSAAAPALTDALNHAGLTMQALDVGHEAEA